MTTIDRKKKLGRGLGALMGETKREEPLVDTSGANNADSQQSHGRDSRLVSIPVSSISPLKGQPRTNFDDAALDELAASIAARGVIQPIIVTPKGNNRYELVAGERRWRAAQRARLHAIPAIVRDLDDSEVMALALVENLQREDLHPIEEARAYQRLIEQEGMTQADVARLVDKSRSHVANLQRLLALPDAVLDLVAANRLSMGHARALIGHDDARQLASEAVEKGLSVREVEKLAKRPKLDKSAGKTRAYREEATGDSADITAVQGHLQEFLGLPVKIAMGKSASNGTVTVSYRTLDQLDLICQRLTGGEL